MRARRALTGLTLGSALVLGGATATAQAAVPAQPAGTAVGSVNVYPSPEACVAAGKATGKRFSCTYWDFAFGWGLQIYG
ncbi:hypothetical protein BX286_0276 [Streptomyces sp. 3211.6]|uniref:hypothetical protein n=1 Tax=Streptomyces TaxID=1883 RepID=UPI000C2CB13A|nr:MULTISPECIES: hypothetical protein [Streptomyces]RKT02375.1 hypothetical protein BX286_0276 [Streptomyces sp. 3211.6]RPF43692.1 hypothetical protein EDD96_0199 [Streptomyces sp. Ag109_G2-6]